MHNFLRFTTFLVAVTLIGCGATLPKVKPYKMDIQQGNVVTSEMLLKLRPGMTKSQVKYVMGTPLLVDSFRTNRWDYFYQLRKQGKIVNQRRVILDFENDLLKGVRGDVVPKGKTVEDVAKQVQEEAGVKEGSAAAEEGQAESLEPIVSPIEAPVIDPVKEGAEAALEEASEGDEVPASVLAVPVEASTAAVDMVEPEPISAEAVESEISPSAAENLVEPIVSETLGDAASTTLATDVSKELLTVAPSKAREDKMLFRLDYSLNTSRIIPQEVSGSTAPLQDSVVQKVEESQEPAKVPNFFERMLEKIGF